MSGGGAGGKERGHQRGDDGKSGEAVEGFALRVLRLFCLFWDPTFFEDGKISCLDFRTDIIEFA